MHIPDGLLPPALSLAGYGLSFSLSVGIFLKSAQRLLLNRMTQVSLVAATVFISSLLHIPMGFTSVHFTFVGLAGILLGPLSFIAVSMAIFLQWLLLGHGGIVTLGVNAFNMGFAALAAYLVYHTLRNYLPSGKKYSVALAVPAGLLSAFIKVLLGSTFLVLGGFPAETFYLILFAHTPVIIGEGIIAGVVAGYLLKHFQGSAHDSAVYKLTKQKDLQTSTSST